MQELIDALEKLAEIEESLPIRLDFDSARQRLYAEIGKLYVESYATIMPKPKPKTRKDYPTLY